VVRAGYLIQDVQAYTLKAELWTRPFEIEDVSPTAAGDVARDQRILPGQAAAQLPTFMKRL
jgi:hypothetical protein